MALKKGRNKKNSRFGAWYTEDRAIRRKECGGWAGLRGGQVVENFVGEEEFEVYVIFDRDVVEVLVDGVDVVVGAGLVKQAGCRALRILERSNSMLLQSGSDECVDQSFSGRKEERWTETGDVFWVKGDFFGDVVGVVF